MQFLPFVLFCYFSSDRPSALDSHPLKGSCLHRKPLVILMFSAINIDEATALITKSNFEMGAAFSGGVGTR